MLHDIGSPAEMTADELYAAYRAALRETVTAVGAETATAATGLAPEQVAALADGTDPESSDLTLEEATSLLALTGEETGEEMAALAREDVLIGMSSAVLDVEALAARLEGDLEPREIQSKIEGRFPMTLREFALIRAYIGSQTGE